MTTATEFLASAQIHAAYEDFISQAKSRLTLVVPWFTPTGQLKDALFGMLQKNVALTLVTRPPAQAKNRQHDKMLGELLDRQRTVKRKKGLLGFGKKEEHDLIELLLVKDVHAKMMIQDEDAVVVSSMNLNTMSIARNTEFGMLSREKLVIERALSGVGNLRVTDRVTKIGEDGVRKCRCDGWIFESGHEACWSCFRADTGGAEHDEDENDLGEESPEKAAPAPEAQKPDATICPECGKKKDRRYPRCRDCYYAAKNGHEPARAASNDKNVCPKCGGSKVAFFPLCRDCAAKAKG